MGRGFGALAKPTGKCTCDNPRWFREPQGVDFVERGTKLRYSLQCKNCGKWWYTKDRSARQYFDPNEQISRNGKTYGDIFAEADRIEKEALERGVVYAEQALAEAQKNLEKAKKSYEKFIALLEKEKAEEE